ncbi:hypothetical protein StoSoilB20_25910 [Arthrobacter sp. StoSoilB20]|nr:hypothetical protein StoSoilB20_25910 [Arthrobacter sp. StoSoilB20]
MDVGRARTVPESGSQWQTVPMNSLALRIAIAMINDKANATTMRVASVLPVAVPDSGPQSPFRIAAGPGMP